MKTSINYELLNKLTEAITTDSLLLLRYCKEKNLQAAKRLLYAKFVNVELQDEAGCTVFHYACIYEDIEMVDLLLRKYLPPHILEEYICHDIENFMHLQEKSENKTILHYISEKNLVDFYNKFELYFPHKLGRIINYTTYDGSTPLHFTCVKANPLILEKLLRIPELEINKVNNHGETALHLACQLNHFSIVRQLLLHPQLDVNIRNNQGDTPLHQVCKSQYYGIGLIAKELLKMASINVELKNNQQLLAIELAKVYNHHEIEALIKSVHNN